VGSNPATGARDREHLEHEFAATICAEGTGATDALQHFGQTVVPTPRAQDYPMNLAYIPGTPSPVPGH